MFVKAIKQGASNQAVQEKFQHLDNIVSRYFHLILDPLVEMYSDYVKLPDENYQIDAQIKDNPQYTSYFQDYLSALDKTHIDVQIPYKKRTLCQNYKGTLS